MWGLLERKRRSPLFGRGRRIGGFWLNCAAWKRALKIEILRGESWEPRQAGRKSQRQTMLPENGQKSENIGDGRPKAKNHENGLLEPPKENDGHARERAPLLGFWGRRAPFSTLRPWRFAADAETSQSVSLRNEPERSSGRLGQKPPPWLWPRTPAGEPAPTSCGRHAGA